MIIITHQHHYCACHYLSLLLLLAYINAKHTHTHSYYVTRLTIRESVRIARVCVRLRIAVFLSALPRSPIKSFFFSPHYSLLHSYSVPATYVP